MLEIPDHVKQQDFKERSQKCLDEIKPILERYSLELAARLQPAESAILALPCFKDTKYTPKKSPIQVV